MSRLTKTQKELLFEFNPESTDFGMDSGLVTIFESQVALTPGHIAVEFNGETLTYRQINARANKVAGQILKNGLGKGSLVGVCVGRSNDLAVAVLGILKAGCGYVPFDPAYPADRISWMLSEAGIKNILIHEANREVFEGSGVTLTAIDREWNQFETFSEQNPGIETGPDDIAYVLFTSGSTGKPKGVAMVQKALVNLVEWQRTQAGLNAPSRTLQFAPISFDVSFQELFTTWATGGTVVFIEDEMRLNAGNLLRFIGERNIDRLFLPFIALQYLTEISVNTKQWPATLNDLITAGEQLQVTRQVREFFTHLPHCRLHNHYGPTETHVVTSYTLTGKPDTWITLPPIGRPVSHTHVYLLDENLLPVPHGEEGEIYIAGAALAAGYINREELTRERFLENPFTAGSRIYKTGDIGKYLPDGNIEYLGRTDSQVKVRGYRIEPGEVEVALSGYTGVTQAAVTVREDAPGDKRLVAYLTSAENHKITAGEIRSFIAGKLPDYMIPSAFVFLAEFPKTPSGKIDRKALPAPDGRRPETGVPYMEPQSHEEKNISRTWAKLLGIDKVGTLDNFFELGGNSLLALQSINLLRQEHGIEIPVVQLYRTPDIKNLLAALAGSTSALSPLEKAKKQLEGKQGQVSGEQTVEDGIAIIGMSGKFPGATNVEEFWQNMLEGKETTTFFSPGQLDPFIDPSLVSDPTYVRARGVISDYDKFDASFFNVSPKLAELMDPQQRIFLEICWNALENAGYSAANYDGIIGVFAGMGNNTYYTNNVLQHKDSVERVGPFQVMVANEKDYIATRISYAMNLTGPGVSVHTACSTSLTAVAMACESLRNRQCDMAIAGGIAITSPVNSGHLYQEGGMFSSDGHTRSFDEKASGTVFSDGGGAVILKRYRDAVADGDTITAVIRGVGINNDGSAKASFTAPSVDGQAAAIAMALTDANCSPDTITYVETHGTATPLGDPIEMEALTLAYRGATDKKQYCAVGSVKSNFGHLTSAAGVAGLIKTALSLKHRVLPASLHFTKPNPAIDFESTPFFVNSTRREWKTAGEPRRAGISSFGVGGTNVHIIVEEAPAMQPAGPSRSKHLFMLSARGSERLQEATQNLEKYLKQHPEINPADAAFTLQTGRVSFPDRKFVVAGDIPEAVEQLSNPSPLKSGVRHLDQPAGGVVFMFPGQGSQYVNMGSNLYRDELIFKAAVDECAAMLQPLLNCDIRSILYPAIGKENEAAEKLKNTGFTQPALFTIGYSLAKLWIHWGIQPSALIGHSIGEFCAACIGGVMNLEDALTAVANRARMMQALPSGAMLSVRISAEEASAYLNGELSVAAINGPSLCVLSGTNKAVDAVQKVLESKDIVCKKLVTSHAFHSAMMDPMVKPFREVMETIKLNPPAIPIVSTATSRLLSDAEATSPEYWAGHLRNPVRFAEGIRTVWEENPSRFLLELGPRNTASTLARQQATDLKKQFAFPSLPDTSDNDAEWNSMLVAVGQLWLSGVNIDWNNFYSLEKRKHIALPGYPFERKRFWVDPASVSRGINTFHPYEMMQQIIPVAQGNMPVNTVSIKQEITSTMNMPSRKERIIAELKNVMEEASGIELASASPTLSFIELGLDSLFLTQAALTISRKYDTKVTFRQLNEDLANLDLLASHLDKILPAEAPVQAVVPPAMPAATPSVAVPNATGNMDMQWLIMQQMQIMQQQLAAMGSAPTMAQPVYQAPHREDETITHHATKSEISANEKADLEKPFGAIARIEKSVSTELSARQKKWLEDFRIKYNSKTARSKSYTQEHRAHLADPRVVTGFKPNLKELIYQVVVERSKGCRMWDIDGNEYVDVLNGFGSNFLGYGSPVIMQAVEEQLQKGIELGPQHPLAGEITRLICEFTGYDRAGLCNTGSEAVLGAMRIARTVTGRNLIVCFNGSYHGINDEVIVRGTRKLKSFPAAAGIPFESVQNMLVLDYGTDEALDIIRSRAGEIAAVMVEPIQSRRADFRPVEFIREVRKITSESGSLLIFDEVITGFRLLPGGAQEFYGVKADVSTYGKVIGGGMPIGAIAGRKDFMDALDGGFWNFGDDSIPEAGVTYFAGTFVRHPLALAAGTAVLKHLKERGMEIYSKLNGYTDRLVNEVNQFCTAAGAPLHLVSFGSLFKVKWDEEQPYGELIFLLLRNKGLHIYDGFPCFFTDAFTDADVKFVIDTFIEAIRELQEVGFLPALTSSNHQPVEGTRELVTDPSNPPVAGARLGKDQHGNPAWFVADPDRPGKFRQVFVS